MVSIGRSRSSATIKCQHVEFTQLFVHLSPDSMLAMCPRSRVFVSSFIWPSCSEAPHTLHTTTHLAHLWHHALLHAHLWHLLHRLRHVHLGHSSYVHHIWGHLRSSSIWHSTSNIH